MNTYGNKQHGVKEAISVFLIFMLQKLSPIKIQIYLNSLRIIFLVE